MFYYHFRYGKIRYAVNTARQRKLMEADVILRSILEQAKVGIKRMESPHTKLLSLTEADAQ